MARIVYSALVSAIHGSIGGTTFQRNAYGYTVKKKPNIVNPNTIPQSFPRGRLQTLAGIWPTLSVAQRNAWNTYAAANLVPSRLNPNAYLSGQAQWLRINLLRLQCGLSRLDTIVSSTQSVLTYVQPVIQNTAGTLLWYDDSTDSANAMTAMVCLSGQVKASILYDRSRTRFIDSNPLSISGIANDITAKYQSKFGRVAQTLDRIFLRSIYFNRNNGQVIYYPPTNVQVN